MKNSVLIMGIDGASWDLLNPWIEQGKLPTLKRLLDEGSKGNLKTTIPPLSCSAWTSLFTGTNPGKHGIYDYVTESGKLINSRKIKGKKIWQILSKYNKRCCVINVPMTYPVEEINGYMVSSILTPKSEKIYSYPTELMSLLKKYDYRIGVEYEKNDPLMPDKQDILKRRDYFLKELYYVMEKRYLTLKSLMNKKWDFFMFVITESTQVKDLFWDKKEVILEFYQKLDYYLNDLIKAYSTKNANSYMFIVSDHGFNASPERSFNFRKWMTKKKFIEDKRTFFQRTIPKIYRTLSKMPLSKLMFIFSKPKEIRESFQRKVTESSYIYYRYPGIFIDQNGLGGDEYEELRNKLMAEIRKIRDPETNDIIFKVVEKRESVYSGKNSQFAPDIVLISKHNYAVKFLYDSDKIFDNIKLHLPGRHFSELCGIFLAYGNKINNIAIKDASILDIYPTILHILGIPIPRNTDGKVLRMIFKEDSSLFNKEIILSKSEEQSISEEKDKIKDILEKIKI